MFTKLLSLTAATALCAPFAGAQMNRAIFLLDRSGSMGAPTQSGSSNRCADSLAACLDEIAVFFDTYGVFAEAMVVEFSQGTNYYRRLRPLGGTTDWLTIKADALAAAGSSTTCTGGTQLADSLCQMVTDMEDRIAANPTFFCTSYFYVYSDGGENGSSGACAGGTDTDLTHRCPCDTTWSGSPYTTGSWQEKACSRICGMTGCTLHGVLNARKFNDFSTDTPTVAEQRVFRLLDSVAAQTGGSSYEVDDATGYVAGTGSPFTVLAGGCVLPTTGETLQVHPTEPAHIGSSFTVQLLGTTWPIRFLIAGFASITPGFPFPLSSQTCNIVVQPDLVYVGGLIPNINVPNDPSLIGADIYFQGLATNPLLTDWITSNGLKVKILP